MSTTVARIYESYGNALEASNELRNRGFHRDEIDLISTAGNSNDGEVRDLAAEISKAGIPSDEVASYVAVVDQGNALLVVRAAWGAANKAMKAVDGHGPSAVNELNKEFYLTAATKTKDVSGFSLSAYLGIPLLLSDAAPFSKFWNLPVLLSHSATFSSLFASLSGEYTFGAPKLIDDGAVFSRELGIPVLLDVVSGRATARD